MPKRAPDWWLSAWDEYGHSLDTGRIVQITAGILAPESDPAVAVSVAGETPITLTSDAVTRFQEYLDWAVEEHQQLLRRADQATDTGTGDEPEAVMTEMQRKAQREALRVIEAKKPTDRINYALFYLQASVGRFLIGRDGRDDLAWRHEVAQELANLTDHEITTLSDQQRRPGVTADERPPEPSSQEREHQHRDGIQ